jgi:hypothetical protein
VPTTNAAQVSPYDARPVRRATTDGISCIDTSMFSVTASSAGWVSAITEVYEITPLSREHCRLRWTFAVSLRGVLGKTEPLHRAQLADRSEASAQDARACRPRALVARMIRLPTQFARGSGLVEAVARCARQALARSPRPSSSTPSLTSVSLYVFRCYSPANSHLLNTHHYRLTDANYVGLQSN